MADLPEIIIYPDEVTKPTKPTVSHSEVDSYLRCERAHFYGYGLNIQRKTESDSLRRGTLGHAALETYFKALLNGSDDAEAQRLTGEFLTGVLMSEPLMGALVSEVMECLVWFFRAKPFAGWTILAVEQEYVLPVFDGLDFPIVVDLIAQDQFGHVWVIDHKFMYDFITDADEEVMPQLAKYVGALRAMGHTIHKAGYSVLRYRSIKDPTLEQKYRFVPATLTDERVKRTFIEQAVTARRLQEIKSEPLEVQSYNAIRTANKMVCKSCGFKAICVAELNNYQPTLVLDSQYKQRERRDFKSTEMLEIEA